MFPQISNQSQQQSALTESSSIVEMSEYLVLSNQARMQSISNEIFAEFKRIAEGQKAQREMLNERIDLLKMNLNQIESQLTENEILQKEQKQIADQKKTLQQEQIQVIHQQITGLQEKFNK